MTTDYVKKAVEIFERFEKNKTIKDSVAELKKELLKSSETFVWKIFDDILNQDDIQAGFNSAWIFVLRKDTPSHAHFHPNSIQYTVMIEGKASCEIGGQKRVLQKFDPLSTDTVYIIDKGVLHEFFPENNDLVVLSLHTVRAEELIEVDGSNKKERTYQ